MIPYYVHNTITGETTTNTNVPVPFISIKWPALLVSGTPVTEDQAREIIFRTDRLSFFCNDDKFTDMALESFGVVKGEYGHWIEDDTRETFKILSLNYMDNNRIASAWIGGLHGWMAWDGTVGCNNYNIGKWPCVDEVRDDLVAIATAFPFLDMRVQLLNHEAGEDDANTEVTVEFTVKDGIVTMFLPGASTTPLAVAEFGPIDFTMQRAVHITAAEFKKQFGLFVKQIGLDTTA